MRRLFRIRTPRGIASEVDDELRFHLATRVDELLQTGVCDSAEDAHARALKEFGDLDAARRELASMDRQRARRAARAEWWSDAARDARYALRALKRQPAFTLVILTTLALGIGANAAIFALIDAVQLRSLPVDHPERLVALGDPSMSGSIGSSSSVRADLFSYAVYRELRDRNPFVDGLAATGVIGRPLNMATGQTSELEHPRGRFVSANYFRVLGVGAQIGRTLDDTEDGEVGATPVVVISDGYWSRRFANDRSAVGRQLTIDGVTFTIIGVAERRFSGEIVGESTDVWIPITLQPRMMPQAPRLDDRREYWLTLLGRLKPGATLAQAEARFHTLIRQALEEEVRRDPARMHLPRSLVMFVGSGATGISALRDDYATPLLTMMIGVGLLLLIVCANVGNLLLARAVARSREMAVRVAIGAGRLRLVRQLLTESAVLSVLAGTAGLIVAAWGSRLLLMMVSGGSNPISLEVHLDLRVVLFTLLVSLAAVMVFGLAPAVRASRADAASLLRSQGRGTVGGRASGRSALVRTLIVGQVALSIVLLVGAALLVRSLHSIRHVDPGFDRDHLLIVTVNDEARGYDGERHLALVQELSARLASLSGIAAVSFSELGLFTSDDWHTNITVPGFIVRAPEDSSVGVDQVGPEYFRTIGARLLQGREFTPQDQVGAPPGIVVNETMARFYFGAASPLGRTVIFSDSARKPFAIQIIGVIGDVRYRSLTEHPTPRVYAAYLQHPGDAPPREVRFEIRATGDPTALIRSVRAAIASVDPLLPIDDLYPLTSRMRESIARETLLARLASGFGAMALFLAALGLYGVTAHAVSRRTGELGLRVALGAMQGDIVALVLRDALSMVMVGVALGVPAGLAATRLLRGQVHGVQPIDPLSIGIALAVLTATATLAALIPAIRAGRVSPIVALEQE